MIVRFWKTYWSIFAGTYEGLCKPRVCIATVVFLLWCCLCICAIVWPALAVSQGWYAEAFWRFVCAGSGAVLLLPVCLWVTDWTTD